MPEQYLDNKKRKPNVITSQKKVSATKANIKGKAKSVPKNDLLQTDYTSGWSIGRKSP